MCSYVGMYTFQEELLIKSDEVSNGKGLGRAGISEQMAFD